MTMQAKSDLTTVSEAMDNMTPSERQQFVSFVEGMVFKTGLDKDKAAAAETEKQGGE